MARHYTREQLLAFIGRADTMAKILTAEDFIAKLDIPEDLRAELTRKIQDKEEAVALKDGWLCYDDLVMTDRDEDRGCYSPSAPWNAPGMKVSDFI